MCASSVHLMFNHIRQNGPYRNKQSYARNEPFQCENGKKIECSVYGAIIIYEWFLFWVHHHRMHHITNTLIISRIETKTKKKWTFSYPIFVLLSLCFFFVFNFWEKWILVTTMKYSVYFFPLHFWCVLRSRLRFTYFDNHLLSKSSISFNSFAPSFHLKDKKDEERQ